MIRVTEPLMKKRSRDTVATEYETQVQYSQLPGQSPVYVSSYNKSVSRSGYAISGWDIPNYHIRVKKGELIPDTPFWSFNVNGQTSGTFSEYWDATYNYIHYYVAPQYTPFETWAIFYDDIVTHAPEITNKYVMEAAANIYQNGYDALTALAELKDVFRTFRAILPKIRSILKEVSSIRKVTNNWLEYRYGWRTLVFDIRNLNDAISAFNEKRTRYSEAAGTKWTSEYLDGGEVDLVSKIVEWTIKDTVEVSLRGHVVADIDVPKFQFNPLQTAWEIIPLSFVVDWVWRVGTSISAMTFAIRCKAYTASSGYSVRMKREFESHIQKIVNSHIVSSTRSQTATSEAILHYRQPAVISYFPQFALRIDRAKVLDLFSLIFQRLN